MAKIIVHVYTLPPYWREEFFLTSILSLSPELFQSQNGRQSQNGAAKTSSDTHDWQPGHFMKVTWFQESNWTPSLPCIILQTVNSLMANHFLFCMYSMCWDFFLYPVFLICAKTKLLNPPAPNLSHLFACVSFFICQINQYIFDFKFKCVRIETK